ncbi:MAG: ABC transporter permease [Chloroflexi bacterium]|nr:ABC transporter permease [Chloroflexota bacterium]MCC6895048.1 ABC transporter permease [Anaerolineae bacterium]
MFKLIRDTRLVFGRSLQVSLRNSVWLIIGLFQPLLYMLLYAPLLDSMIPGGKALQTFTPGLLTMMAMLGPAFAGFKLIDDLRAGVVERLRVTPVSRMALLLGPVLVDVLLLLVQVTLLQIVAFAMGLRIDISGIVVAFVLISLIGMGMAAMSYGVALVIRDEGGIAATFNFLTQPILLLSGILIPLTFAPTLIKTIASINPFSHVVDATRALFDGRMGDPSIVPAFGLMIVMVAIFTVWASRMFRTANS